MEQTLSLADLNCSPLLRAGSRAARAEVRVAVSGVANRMNYRATVTVHTTGGPRGEDP